MMKYIPFLLQKRSEAQISLASTRPDYEIVEPARTITSKIVAPKQTINYMIALFFGSAFPNSLSDDKRLFR